MYEPRRGSVMVKTIDATTTDRLRRSPLYIWTVSKLRSQASLHGVNHNTPFPTALKVHFSTFSSHVTLRLCQMVGVQCTTIIIGRREVSRPNQDGLSIDEFCGFC
nr:MAG TPA: hypothetical protein [Bacteriophage sp.]